MRVEVEPKGRLGRHRWAVERTLARVERDRWLAVRDERCHGIHRALPTLARCAVCHGHPDRL